MIKPLFHLALLLVSFGAFSQRLVPTFGNIPMAEATMTTYPDEPEAEAVVLYDIGESIFFDTRNGYDIRFTRTKRIKILTKEGISQATIRIPFYVESPDKVEKVTSIEAFTYNVDDGRVFRKALDPSAVFEEQLKNNWRVKKFVFPDVREGSIIEFRYVHETPLHFNLPDWEFQTNIPTAYSEYTVRMIPFYEYAFIAQGISRFDYQNSEISKKVRVWGSLADDGFRVGGVNTGDGLEFYDYVHTYAMKNIPSFKDMSFLTSREDYIMKMDFQLSKFHYPRGGSKDIITTWPALNAALLKHENFGKYISGSAKIGKKILENDLKIGALEVDKKVETIVSYVRSNYRWSGVDQQYAIKSPKEFYEQKTGTSGEINLFLLGLLKAANINAEPVIVSTRSHGKIQSNYPFDHYFNGVVIIINHQRAYLTDGTESQIAYDRVAPRYINDKGLIVKEKEVEWVTLETLLPSLDEKTIVMKIDPTSATAVVNVTIASTEYKSLEYKTLFENDSAKIKKDFAKQYAIDVTSTRLLNHDSPNRPYVISVRGVTQLEKLGGKIVISPFLNFPEKENQLIQQKRTYPVDFIYPRTVKMKSMITVPEGYKLVTLPKNVTMDNEMAKISLVFLPKSNEIEVTGEYLLKKSIYPPSEYSKLKYYYGMIVSGFNAQVVLEKSN